MIETVKSDRQREIEARRAYEASVAEKPTYSDGTPRKPWGELDTLTQWTWTRERP